MKSFVTVLALALLISSCASTNNKRNPASDADVIDESNIVNYGDLAIFTEDTYVGRNYNNTEYDVNKKFPFQLGSNTYVCVLTAIKVPANTDAFIRSGRKLLIDKESSNSTSTPPNASYFVYLFDLNTKKMVAKVGCDNASYLINKSLFKALNIYIKPGPTSAKPYDVKYEKNESNEEAETQDI